ncbi:MAG TPA: DUF1549 and DUF1553 domain-containing protein [Planctomycetota bacterium]|nr:DUF1549 and DUF1553 domain-containing protein [Planctomycetota bacterium]
MRHAVLLLAILAASAAAPAQDVTVTGSALIDREISRTWKDASLVPSPPSDDAEFLRRVFLDITGTLPAPDEILGFLSNRSPDKRASKIDQLLTRPEYAHAWAELWENILIGYDQQSRNDSKKALYTWLRDEVFAKNLSYDKMVRALIASTGINTECGPVNFLIKLSRKDGMGGISMASKASKLFMSTQIQCAQCHDHPFDRFTQDDFYGMVAFFARTKSKKVDSKEQKDTRYELFDAPTGEASFGEGKTKKNVSPRFLDELPPDKDLPRREAFANLLIRRENPLFAKSVVNRYWARFFGRGIIEPVDDFSNRFKPSHPELLDRLAADFVAHGYDLAWLIKAIANSHSYQVSSRKPENSGSERLFTHAATRPLTPEQLAASLLDALGVADGQGPAKNMADLLRQFRQRFGDEEAADRGLFAGTIPQALMIMNGAMPNGEIGRANNTLDKILKQWTAPHDRLERIFLSVLCRRPTPREKSKYLPYVEAGGVKKDAYEDVFWVLMNSSEFMFNH